MSETHPTVLYFNKATADVYAVFHEQLPSGWQLLTLDGDDESERLARLPHADFLLVAHNFVTAEHLRAAARLRLIQHQGVGYDRIDLAACRAFGVPVALCPEGTSVAVAEHTLLLILALGRRLGEARDALLNEGRWLQWELRIGSFELSGKRLGLVGFGRIGRAVAERAAAFGARVRYYDPLVPSPPEGLAAEPAASLDELLTDSDIVSLHCPLSPATQGLVDASFLARMKRGAILINAARGALVVESALIDALRSGHLAGAGLDVLCEEPPPAGHPLLRMANVLVTPHIAAGTEDALRAKAQFAFANMERVLCGEAPQHLVTESLRPAAGEGPGSSEAGPSPSEAPA